MIEIADLVRGLASRIESLARELMPAGRKEGAEWRDADAPAGRGSSLYVHLTGSKAGVWSHFSAAQSGDALDLVAYVKFGGDKKQAYHWARAWLGLWDGKAAPARPSTSTAPAPSAAPSCDDDEIVAEKKRRRATAAFLAAQPQLRGTAADWYLKARGIDLARLERQPGCLRFEPACRYPNSLYPPGGTYPAMIAAITRPDGAIAAVHCTYLEIHAIGRAAKLSTVPKKKLVFGRKRGGLIRLWRGTITSDETGEIRRAPSLSDLDARVEGLWKRGWTGTALQEIHLTEGIEDALTLPMECPEWRVAAAVDVGNLWTLRLPEAIRRVVIWKQNDPATDATGRAHPTLRALDKAYRWLQAFGKRVEIVHVPSGFKDVNDYWRSVA